MYFHPSRFENTKSLQDDVYIYIYIFLTHKAYNLIMDCTLYSVFRLIESAVRMQIHTCESWLIFVASCHVGGLFSEIIVLLQLAAIVFDADLDV